MAILKASSKTDISVKPSRSQVVLVMFVLVTIICLSTGFTFLWDNKNGAWIPISIGIAVFVLTAFLWSRSQKDIDLDNAHPTSMTDAAGNVVVTDTRALMSPDGLQVLAKWMSDLAHREPLPKPNGLIDDGGNPIRGSEETAAEAIDVANSKARQMAKLVSEKTGGAQDHDEGVMQPLEAEPYVDVVVTKNTNSDE